MRGIFLNKEGKALCEWVPEIESNLLMIIVITYYIFSDSKGFKHFLRLTWEPFAEKFKPIELRFFNNAEVVFRSAMIHGVNMQHQNQADLKKYLENMEHQHHLANAEHQTPQSHLSTMEHKNCLAKNEHQNNASHAYKKEIQESQGGEYFTY